VFASAFSLATAGYRSLRSLYARLAAFHFEIKAKMNADDPYESPAEQSSGGI